VAARKKSKSFPQAPKRILASVFMSELKLRPPSLQAVEGKGPAAGAAAHSQKWLCHIRRDLLSLELYADYEIPVGDVGVGHARSVEGEARIAFAIEKDEAAGGVSARGENTHGLASGERRDIGR
jgi:hypothetical protein